MFNFLHTFSPEPILISFGSLNIYYYGLFMVLGMILGIFTTLKLASFYGIKKNAIIDLSFFLIIGGVIGGRIYHIFLELPYYLENPSAVFKIWQGGLAIHGGIIAGLIIMWFFVKKYQISSNELSPFKEKFWTLAALIAPGLALAQAIGRWGNYFNQELFGRPTNLPWGIPVDIMNRPVEYISFEFFHPTFLYESIGNLFIFIILIIFHIIIIKKYKTKTKPVIGYKLLAISYLMMYSMLRFGLEFMRTDITPIILGMRFPQIISLLVIVLSFFLLIIPSLAKGDRGI